MRYLISALLLFAAADATAAPAPVFAYVEPRYGDGATPWLELSQDRCYSWGVPSVSVTGRELAVSQTVTAIAGCTATGAQRTSFALAPLAVGSYRVTYTPQPVGFGPMPVSVVDFDVRPSFTPTSQPLRIEPAFPLALEPIHVVYPTTECFAITGMRFVDGAFRVERRYTGVPPIACDTVSDESVTLGALPPGTYRVELVTPSVGSGAGDISVLEFAVRPGVASAPGQRVMPIQDRTGLWVSPNEEPSTGITLLHTRNAEGDLLIGIWYRYAPDGEATWYWFEATDASTASPVYTGPVYAYTSPNATAPGWQRQVARTPVGTISLNFPRGLSPPVRVTATLDGAPLEFDLQRFRFLRTAWPAP